MKFLNEDGIDLQNAQSYSDKGETLLIRII
jgi:hypothetical protein